MLKQITGICLNDLVFSSVDYIQAFGLLLETKVCFKVKMTPIVALDPNIVGLHSL